jgi:5-methylcytosine-specific restriction protein B
VTEHMLLRIAWRPNGWLGGLCSDPVNNVICERFTDIKRRKQEEGVCTEDSFYCVDEHAAFSEWWVRTHSRGVPRRLQEGRSLIFLLSHNPSKGEDLYYVGFYRLKELQEDKNGSERILVADGDLSVYLDPDLVELKEYPIDKWGSGFRYVGDDIAIVILQRALEAHKRKIGTVAPAERAQWQKVVEKLEKNLVILEAELPPGAKESPLEGELSRYFAAYGLHFTPEQLATFYTALKTKGFVILTGISGTGKTKLAQYFAELLGSKDQFHFAAVRPDWRDSKSLLGYFNPLLGQEGQFQSTEFLGFILEATEQYQGSGDSKREDLLALVEKLIEFDSPPTRADLPEEARELVQRQPGIQRISRETFAEILDLAAVADHFDLSQVTQTFLLRLHEISPYADEPRKQYHFRMGIPGSRQLSGSLSKGEKVAFVYYSPDRGLWAAGTFDRMERRESRAFPHVPYFVLLDEMNLAKVEYYFADFLSVLESGRRDEDLFTKEAIRFQYPEGIDGPPRQLRLPPNLYFIGTVNVDETTYMFSPKVLDRAFTLELSTVNLEEYPGKRGELLSDEALEQLRAQLLPDFTNQGRFAIVDKRTVANFVQRQPIYREHLTELNALLQPHDLHFGYRVFDEIMMFLANAHGSPVFDGFNSSLDAAFDAAVLMKVLPKFHGTRGKLRLPLLNVFAWAMTLSAGYDLRKQVEGLEKEISGSEEKEKARLDLIEELRENPDEARIGGETFAYPRTALKALRMLHALYTTGFASFA